MSSKSQRLRRLVRYRDQLERVQQQRLAVALHAHAEREHQLAVARDQREATLRVPPVTDPTEAGGRDAFLLRLDREITAREAALAHSAGLVQDERSALLARSRDRKAMETLLDHAAEAERAARRLAERKQADAVAGRQWLDRGGPA